MTGVSSVAIPFANNKRSFIDNRVIRVPVIPAGNDGNGGSSGDDGANSGEEEGVDEDEVESVDGGVGVAGGKIG